jgi:tripartite ATP-independent transporter DctM subunit
MEIKAMVDDGYSEEFSVAVTGASATIGPILPPSIPVVLYGALAGASIAKLLIAGFVPGVLMGIGLMALIVILTRKYGYQPKQKASFSERWIALKRGFLPLLTPVILVGGIISGVFTPTEAAAVAVVYTFLLGLLYKNLTVESFLTVLKDTMRDSAIILFVVGASSIYSWVIARYQVTAVVVDWITMTIESPYVFLLVINIFLLIIGCFIDPTPAIFILVPVLVPLAQVYGIDISHFGIIMIFNLMIGLITPPVGTVLYALARIRDVPFQRIVYAMIPFYIPLLLTLLVITLVPAISLWLPGFIM